MTVGQDLLKMETGGEATDIKKAGGQTPKSPATDDQPTSSYPEPPNDNKKGGHDEKSQPLSPPSPQTPKESSATDINQHQQTKSNAKGPITSDSKLLVDQPSFGNREERRVFTHSSMHCLKMS